MFDGRRNHGNDTTRLRLQKCSSLNRNIGGARDQGGPNHCQASRGESGSGGLKPSTARGRARKNEKIKKSTNEAVRSLKTKERRFWGRLKAVRLLKTASLRDLYRYVTENKLVDSISKAKTD
jgi:hypothetical protein